MRKLWIWFLLLMTTVVIIAGRGLLPLGLSSLRLPSAWSPPSLQSPAPAVAQQPILPPVVHSERLLEDLQAMAFVRFSDSERQRARDYIQQALTASGWTTQLQAFPGGVNLFAERPGTDPSLGKIILGAHYDTVAASPGADDNATSVATVLEAARLWGSLGSTPSPDQPPPTPARTLQLVFFDLEEQGLLGSRAFVEEQVQPRTVQGAVILDMLGYACQESGCQRYPALPLPSTPERGNFLAAIGDQGHRSILGSFRKIDQAPESADALNRLAQPPLPPVMTLEVPTLGGLAPDLVRSDHAPFWKQGIGAVLVTDTANFRNPHYHQPSDTIETIDLDFFVGSAQIVINAVSDLLQN